MSKWTIRLALLLLCAIAPGGCQLGEQSGDRAGGPSRGSEKPSDRADAPDPAGQRLQHVEVLQSRVYDDRFTFTLRAHFEHGNRDEQEVEMLYRDGEWYIRFAGKPRYGPRGRRDAPGEMDAAEVARAFYGAAIKRVPRRFVEYTDPRVRIREELIKSDSKKWISDWAGERGHLEAVELVDEQVEDDRGAVQLRITFEDGTTEEVEKEMIRFDGLWYIAGEYSEIERDEPPREIQPLPQFNADDTDEYVPEDEQP